MIHDWYRPALSHSEPPQSGDKLSCSGKPNHFTSVYLRKLIPTACIVQHLLLGAPALLQLGAPPELNGRSAYTGGVRARSQMLMAGTCSALQVRGPGARQPELAEGLSGQRRHPGHRPQDGAVHGGWPREGRAQGLGRPVCRGSADAVQEDRQGHGGEDQGRLGGKPK